MSRSLPLADHLTDDQVRTRFRACRDVTERARWQVIWLKTQRCTADALRGRTTTEPPRRAGAAFKK